MNWLRKGFVGLLSIVLLLSLFGIVATASAVHNLQPKKIEAWIAKSKIYDHVIASVVEQSSKDSGSSDSSSVSPSDPEVQKAIESAFSPQLVEQGVNTFIDSNYAWLSGKTAKPEFVIDLTDAKQQFATQVGEAVTKHLSSVPVCTPAQLAQIQLPTNPLTTTCRPAELNPQAEGARVATELSNGDFLSKPLITAATVGQNDQGTQSKPYYEKLSYAPKIYKFSQYAPFILGLVALLAALGVVFFSRDKRRGLRRVGIISLEVGVILIITKFLADTMTKRLEAKILKDSLSGALKQPTSNFIHQVESQLVLLNLIFGIAFILIAIVLFTMLFRTRDSKPKPRKPVADTMLSTPPEPPKAAPRQPQPATSPKPSTDIANRLKPTGPPPLGKNPPRRKPPRLVQ
ncbi:MAG: hypothetical protein AAB436_01090 [Patescibacteria group bacterium]